ncbi:MAG: hypothetical protein ACLQFI_15160 [Methylocella sp.]
MSDWPQNVEVCKNCTGEPSRYAYGACGYCSRCYRLIRHIKDAQTWDRSRRETLKQIPKDGTVDLAVGYSRSSQLMTDKLTDEQFEIWRGETISQLERRLSLLRHREEIRRCHVPVDALTLERKFAELLHLVRRKAEYPSNASYLNTHFNEKERRIIYALLEEIIEQTPWHGMDLSLILERIYPTGK